MKIKVMKWSDMVTGESQCSDKCVYDRKIRKLRLLVMNKLQVVNTGVQSIISKFRNGDLTLSSNAGVRTFERSYPRPRRINSENNREYFLISINSPHIVVPEIFIIY